MLALASFCMILSGRRGYKSVILGAAGGRPKATRTNDLRLPYDGKWWWHPSPNFQALAMTLLWFCQSLGRIYQRQNDREKRILQLPSPARDP